MLLVSVGSLTRARSGSNQETTPAKSAEWALVIGISRYVNADPLQFAASDARSFSEFLQSPRGGNFPAEHLITLLEDEATRFRIFSEFESLQDKVGPGDTVFIFMAGHGIVNRRGIGYFVPSDGDAAMLAPTSVPFSFLKELVELGLGGVDERILITDLCHSGRIGPETSPLAEKIQNLINQELLGLEGGTQGFINLLGSRPTEPSWERDDLQGGVFSHVLLEALNGKAATPGTERLKAEDVVDYVMMEVPRFTANQQHPMVNDGYDRDLSLSYPQLPGPEVTDQETEMCFVRLQTTGVQPYLRIEWADPLSGAQVIRPIPTDTSTLRLGPLQPGSYTFRLWQDDDHFRTVEIELAPGETSLDLDTLATRRGPPVPLNQFAGPFSPAALTQLDTPVVTPSGATLVLRLSAGTVIRIDQSETGSAATDGWVQLEGLEPGQHRIDLIPSPEREYRFRLNLFRGPQLLDWTTGQLRPLARTPRTLDPDLVESQPEPIRSTLRDFEEALWSGDLIAPAGRCAWDLLASMRGSLSPDLNERLSKRLLVAMGDKAQRIVLRYLRGGDVHWLPETFEEGTELLVRVQAGLRSSLTVESQEHFFRGRALLERGSYDQAATELLRSVELDPEASHALNALGLVYWRKNELPIATQFLERALALSPAWTYPRNTLALIRMEQRRYDESQRLFRESMALDPGDSTAVHGLGQLQMLRGEWEAAESSLLQAIDIHPGNAYAHHTLGELNRRQLRFEDAELRFRLAIRLEPDEPAFWISLGGLLQETGRTAAADGVFRDLLRREPSNPNVLLAFAGHLNRTDRFDEAVALVNRTLDLDPDNANLKVQAGLFWLEHDRNRARTLFDSALRLDLDNSYALYNLALLDVGEGNLDRAEQRLRRAVASDPRYPPPYLLRARLLAGGGRLEDAIPLLKTGLSYAVEPAQRQQFEQELSREQAIWMDRRLKTAADLIKEKRLGEAARLYEDLSREVPGSRPLRDSVLSFDARFPNRLASLEPTTGALARALRSPFWRLQPVLQQEWARRAFDNVSDRLLEGIDHLGLGSPLRLTFFNLGNEDFSLHALILRWVDRLLEVGRYGSARQLLDKAIAEQIFAEVPDYRPLTIDSLMVPDEDRSPSVFSDFEVALHPDPRVHEALFLATAGQDDLAGALQYLKALEGKGPDLDLRSRLAGRLGEGGAFAPAAEFLEQTLAQRRASDPSDRSEMLRDGFLLLAELQRRAGHPLEAERTLESAVSLWPTDRTVRRRQQNMGRQGP